MWQSVNYLSIADTLYSIHTVKIVIIIRIVAVDLTLSFSTSVFFLSVVCPIFHQFLYISFWFLLIHALVLLRSRLLDGLSALSGVVFDADRVGAAPRMATVALVDVPVAADGRTVST